MAEFDCLMNYQIVKGHFNVLSGFILVLYRKTKSSDQEFLQLDTWCNSRNFIDYEHYQIYTNRHPIHVGVN
jgi:hypothetical protein